MARLEPEITHVEETHRAMSRLDTEHRRRATTLQRVAEQVTRFIGRPVFLAGLCAVIALWLLGRRDAPALRNRDDDQAAAMARPSGPQSVLDAIESHQRNEPPA